MPVRIYGRDAEASFGAGLPTVIIGERINPTGRKKLSQELAAGRMETLRNDALSQKAAGAHILDVNVAVPGVDEVALLPEAVRVVSDLTGLPICIDSSNPAALRAALRAYPHKALINSVTGEEKSLRSVLPLAQEFKAAVVGLTIDDEGIPESAQRRVEIACKIIERAEGLGISRDDVVIDPLALSVAASPQAAAVTLEAMRALNQEHRLATTLGASNISFGMPERGAINCAFLSLAVGAGLSAAIVNPLEERVMYAVLAANLLLGRDDFGTAYLSYYRSKLPPSEEEPWL